MEVPDNRVAINRVQNEVRIECSNTDAEMLPGKSKNAPDPSRCNMDDFNRNENLALYRQALTESSDQDQRRVLLVLLRLLLLEQAADLSRPLEMAVGSPSDQ
jgi:hypothetical protein